MYLAPFLLLKYSEESSQSPQVEGAVEGLNPQAVRRVVSGKCWMVLGVGGKGPRTGGFLRASKAGSGVLRCAE